ncbi:MAG TPA: gamma carbonic anhydrase family protein [Rhodospirillales bacterium]|nr:gamma carbonic anhydrase family protein [Rhodospirillales bacterium]
MPDSPLILPYKGVLPRIGAGVFIAPGAVVIGDVEIGADCGIWFGAVVRGDVNEIRIGARTNIQDGTIIHVSSGRVGKAPKLATYIGSDVTVGHKAVLHACSIGDGAFIGMGATVMDGAVVEEGAMVAACALVTPGKRVGSGQLWAGAPARFVRRLGDDDRKSITDSVPHYCRLARTYLSAGIGRAEEI